MSEYNLVQILDLVVLDCGYAVMGGLQLQGFQIWYWIRLDWVKGNCWAVAEVCTLLSAVLVQV